MSWMEGGPDRRHTISFKSARGNCAAFQEKNSRNKQNSRKKEKTLKLKNCWWLTAFGAVPVPGARRFSFLILISQRGTAKKVFEPTESNPTSVLN